MTAIRYDHTYDGLTLSYCPACHFMMEHEGPVEVGDTFVPVEANVGDCCEECGATVGDTGWLCMFKPAKQAVRMEVTLWPRSKKPKGVEYLVYFYEANGTRWWGHIMSAVSVSLVTALEAANGCRIDMDPTVQQHLVRRLVEAELPDETRPEWPEEEG